MEQLERSLNPDIPEAFVVSMWAECTVSIRFLELPLLDVPAVGWGHVSAPDCAWHWNPVVS